MRGRLPAAFSTAEYLRRWSHLRSRCFISALASVASACSAGTDGQAHAPPDPPPCAGATFEGTSFTHCIATPKRHSIHLVLGENANEPYRSLSELAAARPSGSAPVAFATNGGMFDQAGHPIGYAVIAGQRMHKLNTNEGWGNFHLVPNGVFFGDATGRWQVRSTESFAREVTQRPDFGTQSGPMLVIAGKLHPKIEKNGRSLKLRNAVGVDRQGRAHFVISDEPVSFGRLARYYRDVLDCPNALYLDGSVSSLWDPDHGRVDGGPPLGPLIVVEKSAKGPDGKDAP